jgi:VWFA-related protein
MRYLPRGLRLALSLALALASAAPALGQKKGEGVVQEKASVTVIEVPVNVLGKDGKPLAGLTAADFELYDNGKKQEITGFEVADLRPPAAEAVNPFLEPPPAAARRHWFLVFDLSYASPTALIRAREGARSLVEKEMGPSDLAGVATVSVEKGWNLVENFTSDRVQLGHAIDSLGLIKTGVRTNDPLSFAFVYPGEIEGLSTQNTNDAFTEAFRDLNRMQQSSSDQRERGRIATHLSSLGQIAQVLNSVRGRKYVLFFSEGFENRMLMGNAGQTAKPLGQTDPTQDTSAESSIAGQSWKIDSDARFGSSATRGFLENALSGFKRADVVLDTIDISGLRAEGEVTRRAGSGADALFTMARETNGDFIRNANQLSGDLRQLIERTDLVYVLAFQPKELAKPGVFHELKVKVRVPASKISARSGYYEPKAYRNLTPMERVLASGDLLSGGGGGSQLPVSMLVAPFASTGKVAQVPVILEIPGKALLEGDTSPVSGVLVYVYATDSRGVLTDYLTQEITLDLKLARAKLETGGIKYYGTLFLPPGQYTLRTLVRNAFTGRSALSTAALTVPSTPGGAPTVRSFFFQDPAAPWVMVKTNPRPNASAASLEYPFAIGGEAFIPAALPLVASGSAVQVAVVTYNFAPGSDPLQVLSEILGPDGKPRKSDIQVVRRSDRERGGARTLLLSFKPEGLEPGRYALRVRVSDRAQKTAEASDEFEVRAP